MIVIMWSTSFGPIWLYWRLRWTNWSWHWSKLISLWKHTKMTSHNSCLKDIWKHQTKTVCVLNQFH